MDEKLPVKTSLLPWRDYSQGSFAGTLTTVNHSTYTVIIITVGVIFGLLYPRAERILSHLFGWTCYGFERFWQGRDLNQSSDENAPMLPVLASEANAQVESKKPKLPRRSCVKWCTKNNFAFGTSVLLLIFGTGWIIMGGFLTEFPIAEAARSGSNTCGAWGLRNDTNSIAQDEDALVQGEKEAKAGQYARGCYGDRSTNTLDQCLIFKKQSIANTIKTRYRCPFQNSTYCYGDGFTAVKFTTHLKDAKEIGVNSGKAPKFNRTTVCVPLNLEAGFVENLDEDVSKVEWGYKLGPVDSEEFSSPYTFSQYGDPFEYDVRSYTMSTYTHVYSKNADQNYWQPVNALAIRPELQSKAKPYSITIMFIKSCRIFYTEASDDPIFPANGKFRATDLWVSLDSRARPLVCIDWIEMCTKKDNCEPPYPVERDDADDREDQFSEFNNFEVFTRFALNRSTIFHAIEFRGATGLDAQYKVRGDTSLPLSKGYPQWVIESWGLFNASLARIQYDAYDTANGTGWDNKLYDWMMPPSAMGKMCNIFTFQIPKGYDNIRVWPLVTEVVVLLVFAWVIGWETKTEFSREKQKSGWFDKHSDPKIYHKLLLIEWCLAWCFGRLPRAADQANLDTVDADHGDDEDDGVQGPVVQDQDEADSDPRRAQV